MTRSKKTEPTSGQASRTSSIPTPRSGFAIARAADQLLQPASDALLHLGEARRDEERFLVARRVVRRSRDLREVEGLQVRLPREAAELAERREQPRAVGLDVAVLPRDAKLERVPVDALQLAERLFVGLPGRLAEEPRQTDDFGPEEARRVSDELVHDVRLRSVERHRVVADVLRRKKDAAAERAEKSAGRNEAGDRQHLDAGARLELLVDLPELRNELLIEVELGGPVAPLRNGVRRMQRREVLPHGAPDGVLRVRVVHGGRRIARPILERQARDRVAAQTVDRVPKPRVVRIQPDQLLFAPRVGSDGIAARVERRRSGMRIVRHETGDCATRGSSRRPVFTKHSGWSLEDTGIAMWRPDRQC